MPSTTEMVRQSANAMARRFADDACRAKHGHLTRAAIYGQWFVEAIKDAGLPERRKDGSDVRDALAAVMDALGDAHGLIEREADNEGIAPECFPLDMTELNDMWAKLDADSALRLHEGV